jgi:hypothetical protein
MLARFEQAWAFAESFIPGMEMSSLVVEHKRSAGAIPYSETLRFFLSHCQQARTLHTPLSKDLELPSGFRILHRDRLASFIERRENKWNDGISWLGVKNAKAVNGDWHSLLRSSPPSSSRLYLTRNACDVLLKATKAKNGLENRTEVSAFVTSSSARYRVEAHVFLCDQVSTVKPLKSRALSTLLTRMGYVIPSHAVGMVWRREFRNSTKAFVSAYEVRLRIAEALLNF